jgi:hypothetical protein
MTRRSKNRQQINFRIPEDIILQLRDIDEHDPHRSGVSGHVVEALRVYCAQKAPESTAERVATLARRTARLDHLFDVLSGWFKGTRDMYARKKFDAWVTKNLGVRNLADCSDEAWRQFETKTERVSLADDDAPLCQRLAWEIAQAANEARSRELLIESTKDQISGDTPADPTVSSGPRNPALLPQPPKISLPPVPAAPKPSQHPDLDGLVAPAPPEDPQRDIKATFDKMLGGR